MLLEEVRLRQSSSARCRPANLALTIVAASKDCDAEALLTAVLDAWLVVAFWGRWCDESAGAWPSPERGIQQLPIWLRTALKAPGLNVEDWMDDLHDRSWIWWSGVSQHDFVTIDLAADSLPCSTWCLRLVIEAAGGGVVYDDVWLDDAAARILRSEYAGLSSRLSGR